MFNYQNSLKKIKEKKNLYFKTKSEIIIIRVYTCQLKLNYNVMPVGTQIHVPIGKRIPE